MFGKKSKTIVEVDPVQKLEHMKDATRLIETKLAEATRDAEVAEARARDKALASDYPAFADAARRAREEVRALRDRHEYAKETLAAAIEADSLQFLRAVIVACEGRASIAHAEALAARDRLTAAQKALEAAVLADEIAFARSSEIGAECNRIVHAARCGKLDRMTYLEMESLRRDIGAAQPGEDISAKRARLKALRRETRVAV